MVRFRYIDKDHIFDDMRAEAFKSRHHGVFLVVVRFFKNDKIVFGFADYAEKNKTLFEAEAIGEAITRFLKE